MGPTVKIIWFNKEGEIASLKSSNSEFVAELFDSCKLVNEPGLRIEIEKGSGDE